VIFTDVVLAGSPGFLDALLAPLQGRLGATPRVADTPHQAFALCQDGARLLVYEFRDREWLPLCSDLRRLAGTGLVIVAALPPEHAAEAAPLSASASAVVPWRGDPRPLLEAVARLGAQPAPAAVSRPAPVLAPMPTLTPPRPVPPASRVPHAAASGTVPPPLRVAPPPAAARASAAPVLLPEEEAPLPLPPSPVQLVPPADEGDPFAGLFDEPAAGGAANVAQPADPPTGGGTDASAPTPPVDEVPFLSSGTWPGTVLSASDAEGLLAGTLVGLWPEDALRSLTERVVAGLSLAEKAALQDQVLPFESGPVRRAAGLRWQVAAALESAPPPGAAVDHAAVRAILSGIDAVLAELTRLSDGAAPEALRAIENVRHLLVKEAIDLTEAVQRLVPEGTAEIALDAAGAGPRARAPGTRIIYNVSGTSEITHPKPWGYIVLLALAGMAAAGYHGYRYVNRPRPAAPVVSGAPSGTVGIVSPQGKFVVAPAGKKLDPREVESFKNLEQAKGNEVREVLPGTFVVVPGAGNKAALEPGAPAAAPSPRTGAAPAQQPPQGAKP